MDTYEILRLALIEGQQLQQDGYQFIGCVARDGKRFYAFRHPNSNRITITVTSLGYTVRKNGLVRKVYVAEQVL